MRLWIRLLGLVLCVLLCTSGCKNMFQEFGDTTTDEAKLYAARLHLDNSEWSLALADIAELSDVFRATREVKAVEASAYAGRCGLDIINIVNSLNNAGSTVLFEVLMDAFPNTVTSQVDDCVTAEGIMKTIDDRTVDESMLLAFIGLAKVGAILNLKLDSDNNGTPDPAFNGCTSIDDDFGTSSDIANMDQVVTGIAIFMKELASAGTTIGGGTTGSLDTLCDTTLGGANDFCDTDEVSSVTDDMRDGARAAICEDSASNLGVGCTAPGGGCAAQDAAACLAGAIAPNC